MCSSLGLSYSFDDDLVSAMLSMGYSFIVLCTVPCDMYMTMLLLLLLLCLLIHIIHKLYLVVESWYHFHCQESLSLSLSFSLWANSQFTVRYILGQCFLSCFIFKLINFVFVFLLFKMIDAAICLFYYINAVFAANCPFIVIIMTIITNRQCL